MFFFSGDDNNYSIYFYTEYDDKKTFVKLIDNLTNYEVSEMVAYIDNQRGFRNYPSKKKNEKENKE